MSILGTESGSSKNARSPSGSVRLSEQGVPNSRKQRNSRGQPCSSQDWPVSDNAQSRFLVLQIQMSRRVSNSLIFPRRLVTCFPVGPPGCNYRANRHLARFWDPAGWQHGLRTFTGSHPACQLRPTFDRHMYRSRIPVAWVELPCYGIGLSLVQLSGTHATIIGTASPLRILKLS
jgi:hypothetical protein